MIEDKIREVMELVDVLKDAWTEFLSVEEEEASAAEDSVTNARSAIESKLRALLEEKQEPQWESIDSAPKEDLILAFQKRWCFAEWSVLHSCWFEEDAPVGGRLNPSHWMPVPPDPCN